ncbi:MAG: hypothetical protein HAW67_01950 [Endozoicomonadaceae bacterium]|nr:hypothetical protein [Endozoicomonadaceae bacterium]
MFLKNRRMRKFLFVFISLIFTVAFVIAYLAIRTISSDDPPLLTQSQKISKTIVMRGLDQFESIFNSATYVPTPFDSPSPDFKYANLSHPYFENIRNDKRVAHFYSLSSNSSDQPPIDFSDAISMKKYLRDLFPHGVASTNFINTNVLEMIDAAEQGEQFLCEDISKMLIQLIQAGGTQARAVGLQSLHSDHVVVEMWSKHFNKWVIIDPDHNIHYTNANGVPLSAIELYVMSQNSHQIEKIQRITDSSPNTLHNTKLIELFYKNGFSIFFYNRWVDQNLPRKHPARSPAIMGVYVGKAKIEKIYHKHHGDVLDDDVIATLYKNPSKH